METSEEVNKPQVCDVTAVPVRCRGNRPPEVAVCSTAEGEELEETRSNCVHQSPSPECPSAGNSAVHRSILQDKSQQHYMNGLKAMRDSEYERAVMCFSKATHLQPQQSHLWVCRGDAFLHLCDFQSSIDCYRRAAGVCTGVCTGVYTDSLAMVYYLQGQCLLDRGLFVDALDCFNKAAAVKPGCRTHQVRRLVCLSAMGRYTECLKMVSDWMALDGPAPDLYVLRARLHKRLNQTSRCYHDVKAALALKPSCPEAAVLLGTLQDAAHRARRAATDRAAMGQMSQALVLINVALENCPQEPSLHLLRGTLHRRMKAFVFAIEDLVRAVELSQDQEGVEGQEEEAKLQLVLTYNDLAVQCFCRGLYQEATRLLTKAIKNHKNDKNQAGLYLNRGDCFFKQGQWCSALADYLQAEALIGPDQPSVHRRLAVLRNTLGSLCCQDGRFQDVVFVFTTPIDSEHTVREKKKKKKKKKKRNTASNTMNMNQ